MLTVILQQTHQIEDLENIEPLVGSLDKIKQLQGVTYQWKDRGAGGDELRIGFIAQEVELAAKSIDYHFSGVDKYGKIWGLRYAEFVPALVKSVQEQQSVIADIEKEKVEQKMLNDDLQKQINLLLNRVKNLERLPSK